jgi:hypothetical protein
MKIDWIAFRHKGFLFFFREKSEQGPTGEVDIAKLQHFLPLIAAYLYFAGWYYAANYYNEFGINVRMVDPPVYYIFVYAFPLLWIFAALAVAAALLYSLVHRLAARFSGVLAVCMGLLMFPILATAAYKVAERDALSARRGFNNDIHAFKLPALDDSALKKLPADLIVADKSGTLRLLSATPTDYLLFSQSDPGNASDLPQMHVFVIPRTAVPAEINVY